jgi:16S rRNA (cytidine1402-2'-O)-methyltransferase
LAQSGTSGASPAESGAIPPFRAEPGALYVVATPIGNLRDVTLRALDILRSVDVVAAEDTRVTATLLRRHEIATQPVSLHAHNEARRADALVAMLAEGRSVALVSDAGTPAVSDPGSRLVRAVRAAGHPIVPIPGASALATAVAAAGLRAETFAFLGFLPQQEKARRARVEPLAALPMALVIYEAPHRVRATAGWLYATLGERDLVVARELTKTFETVALVPLSEAARWFAEDANRERGEFVLIVDSGDAAAPTDVTPDAERWLRALVGEMPPARAARVVAQLTGASREACYARALALKGEAP